MKTGMLKLASFLVFTVILVIFTILAFFIPDAYTFVFWLGYVFAVFAFIVTISVTMGFLGQKNEEDRFLHSPVTFIAAGYFVLQLVLSGWQMISFPFPYMVALIANLILALLASALILCLQAVAQRIDGTKTQSQKKIYFIKQLQIQLDCISVPDPVLDKRIRKLADDVRYSDVMSHSLLESQEEKLYNVILELSQNACDSEKGTALCKEAELLLQRRNQQAKMLKGTKDPEQENAGRSEKSGAVGKFAALWAGIAATVVLLFIMYPMARYQKAANFVVEKNYTEAGIIFEQLGDYKDSPEQLALLDEHKRNDRYEAAVAMIDTDAYLDAILIFTELGDYKESKQMLERISLKQKDARYQSALSLIDTEYYMDAVPMFTELGDYKESKQHLERLQVRYKDGRYSLAERCLTEGKYEEALAIYKELDGYKNANERIVEINNRHTKGDLLYIGMYDGKPMAWKIVLQEQDKLLLIAETPLRQMPMNSTLRVVTFEESTLYNWLTETFLQGFTDEEIARLVPDGGRYISLADKSLMETLTAKKINLETNCDWWLCTADETGFMYVFADGKLAEKGEIVIRDKGVRPVIWITMN